MQHACLCMLHASLMPLKQNLASFALYLINPKYISSFSACCPTAKVGALERVVDKTKRLSEICRDAIVFLILAALTVFLFNHVYNLKYRQKEDPIK